MSTFIFRSIGDVFPVGTTVGAYLPSGQRDAPTRPPALTTAVVASDGSLTFTGLTVGVAYVASDGTRSRSFAVEGVAVVNESRPTAPPPSGGEDSAAVLAAAIGGTVSLGPGQYLLDLGTLARFDIEGSGPDVTSIAPASPTDPIVLGGAAGSKSDDRARLANLSLAMTADRPYDKPLIDMRLSRNMSFENLRADVDTRVGTLFRFDSAYQFHVRDVHLRTGKWVVPLEFLNDMSLPGVGPGAPQCDTMLFEQFMIDGCLGPIFRNATGGIGSTGEVHGIGFDGFKVTQSTFYPTPPSQESTLSGVVVNGATSFPLVDATGIVAGDVLVLDLGRNNCEVVKVASVSTNTITPTTPLRFDHLSGCEVLRGGLCLSMSDGYANLTLDRFHGEGQQVGLALGNVRGVELNGPESGVGQLIRVCDATREVRVHRPKMAGTVNKNELLRRSSNNASSSDDRWLCEDAIVPAGAAIVPNVPAGYFPHGTRCWELTMLTNGVRASYANANTANAGAKKWSVGTNGAGGDKAFVTYGGRGTFTDGVVPKVKAGAISDADFATPVDGLMGIDTTNGKIYVRVGGVWKSATLA